MLLRDTIYTAIRGAILTCEFQPGQELREQVLAERYRVSRSPIRDSLLRLEQENLVTVLPRQGYRVKPISVSEAEDIAGLRLLIEPACAGAAARADDVAVRTLDRFRGFGAREYTEAGQIEYNSAFHRAIADLSGNTRMAAVARELVEQFERLIRVILRNFERDAALRGYGEHEAIIDAVQGHDADRASRLSYEHAQGSHSIVLDALRMDSKRWAGREESVAAAEKTPQIC